MRRLATGAIAFSAAVFAANYVLPLGSLIVSAVVMASLGALLLLSRRRWLRGVEIALLAAALGLTVFSLHARRTILPARELDGQTTEIEATLLDYPDVYDSYCCAEIRLGGELPHLKALLYDNEMQLAGAEPGQTLTLTARLRAADTRYGKDYDYYNAKGIYLTASSKSDIMLTDGGFSVSTFPARARRVVATLTELIFPADTSGFMRSVMLGDKSKLYDNTALYLALSRSGFMHVAAVSGMHVSFLVGFLQYILGRTRGSSLLCIVLIWCFVAMTGAGPSAVRAGFMQSMLLIAPMVRRENDPATSLSAVLALVLLQNPHAAASISLQLSFGAMAGILCFGGHISAHMASLIHSDRLRHVLRYPLGAASVSFAVMLVTVPITAVHFGSVSVLSPLMNIAALWAVSLCFCGGFISCALALIWQPLGVWAAWLVSWAVRYIAAAAKLVSSVPFAVLYFDNEMDAWWLVLTYALVLLAACTRARAAYKLFCPAAFSAAALAVMLVSAKLYYSHGPGTIAVLDVGQGQSIAVMSGGNTVMIDCGGGAKQQRAGETAGAYLLSRGRGRIDALVLTHLHSDHANGVQMLMEMIDVDTLYLPIEPNDDDGLLEPILNSAAAHRTKIVYISTDTGVDFGSISLMLYAPAEAGDANERCIMCLASIGDYDMLVTGDAPAEAEREFIAAHSLHDTELFIAGHHGSKYSNSVELLETIGAHTAVISVGYNSYGHPTQQTLERLSYFGYNIYRTDLNGSVEIRTG